MNKFFYGIPPVAAFIFSQGFDSSLDLLKTCFYFSVIAKIVQKQPFADVPQNRFSQKFCNIHRQSTGVGVSS